MNNITFQFQTPVITSLDRKVTATMTLREAKIINAILGPTTTQDLLNMLVDKSANKQAAFIQEHGNTLYKLYNATHDILCEVGEDF